jgi:hypothetical protein
MASMHEYTHRSAGVRPCTMVAACLAVANRSTGSQVVMLDRGATITCGAAHRRSLALATCAPWQAVGEDILTDAAAYMI